MHFTIPWMTLFSPAIDLNWSVLHITNIMCVGVHEPYARVHTFAVISTTDNDVCVCACKQIELNTQSWVEAHFHMPALLDTQPSCDHLHWKMDCHPPPFPPSPALPNLPLFSSFPTFLHSPSPYPSLYSYITPHSFYHSLPFLTSPSSFSSLPSPTPPPPALIKLPSLLPLSHSSLSLISLLLQFLFPLDSFLTYLVWRTFTRC